MPGTQAVSEVKGAGGPDLCKLVTLHSVGLTGSGIPSHFPLNICSIAEFDIVDNTSHLNNWLAITIQ